MPHWFGIYTLLLRQDSRYSFQCPSHQSMSTFPKFSPVAQSCTSFQYTLRLSATMLLCLSTDPYSISRTPCMIETKSGDQCFGIMSAEMSLSEMYERPDVHCRLNIRRKSSHHRMRSMKSKHRDPLRLGGLWSKVLDGF